MIKNYENRQIMLFLRMIINCIICVLEMAVHIQILFLFADMPSAINEIDFKEIVLTFVTYLVIVAFWALSLYLQIKEKHYGSIAIVVFSVISIYITILSRPHIHQNPISDIKKLETVYYWSNICLSAVLGISQVLILIKRMLTKDTKHMLD